MKPPLPDEAFSLPTIFCVNETEAQLFTGVKVTDPATAEAAGNKLLEMGAKCVLWIVNVLVTAQHVFACLRYSPLDVF